MTGSRGGEQRGCYRLVYAFKVIMLLVESVERFVENDASGTQVVHSRVIGGTNVAARGLFERLKRAERELVFAAGAEADDGDGDWVHVSDHPSRDDGVSDAWRRRASV